ncbi:MAG TPA: tetratricopeptide repeat protein [Gammaproteobacteria bacterium]|nr:tetratricopeptide repeat protein [Gammaproteobacteria bacterium]
MRAWLLGFVVLVATGASAAAATRQPAFDESELASGAALALAPPERPIMIPSFDDTFALDAEMESFVAPLKEVREPRQRMQALVEALEARGMFSLEYAEVTRTARDTFHDRQGNCLSFTMLFVSLARAIGLQASYQSVVVPPTWSNDGQVVVASHVNTAVRTGRGEETIVDFNLRPYQAEHRSRRVGDSYALALFYTNLGAEAMLRNDHPAALAYLREAARVRPDIAGVWVNLGVLYARHGRYEHAEAAYLHALDVDDDEPSALTNLALVYSALGEHELATQYHDRVQSYRERNPYYHFASAARAYDNQRFADALTSLRKALRLKPDEEEFYELRGKVQTALGKSRDATQSFELARSYAEAEELRSRSAVELGIGLQ